MVDKSADPYTDEYLQWLESSFDWSQDVFRGYRSSEGKLKDRVIKHDILHLLIIGDEKQKPIKLKFEDEYSNAIIQAVLEGDPEISRVGYSDECSRVFPKQAAIREESIRKITIPGSVKLLTWALKARDRTLPHSFRANVTREFIQNYIAIGRKFRRMFQEKYGQELVSMPIEDFIRIPFQDLKNIYEVAQKQTRGHVDEKGI